MPLGFSRLTLLSTMDTRSFMERLPVSARVTAWLKRPAFTVLERYERRSLWILFGVALLARILFLESVPNTATADELDYCRNIVQVLTGQGPGFFGLDWTPQPAMSLYFMVWSWHLFGMTLFAERLVSALLTALALFPFYALLRRHVSVAAALGAGLMFMMSRWYLLFSRSGWNNAHIVLYMLLAAWALTRALERRQMRYWVGFGACLALLLYGYFAGRTVVIAFAVYLVLVLWWRLRGRDGGGWQHVLIGGVLAAVVCFALFAPELPTIMADLNTFNGRTNAVLIFNQPLAAGQTRLGVLEQQFWVTFRSFFMMDATTGTGRYKGPGQSWLDPVSAVLYLCGLVLAVRRGRAVALWWGLFLIPLGLTQLLTIGIPDGARAIAATAPMYFFVALTIEWLLGLRWNRGPWIQVALLCVSIMIATVNVVTYVNWVDSPASQDARQPAEPVSAFYTWRDFQFARLETHQGFVVAGDYNTQAPTSIVAQIGQVPWLVNALAGTPTLPATASGSPGAAAGPLPTSRPLSGSGAGSAATARKVRLVGAPGSAAGQLGLPRDVAVDQQGNYYVADALRRKIVKYGPDGHFLLEWGRPGPGPSQFTEPWADVVAPDGTLVVLDSGSGRLVRYSPQGRFLGALVQSDTLALARAMTLGRDRRLYVAQTASNQVAVFTLTGQPLAPLSHDPQGQALFDQPTSMVVQADGRMVVYESDSGRLLFLSAGGSVRFTLSAPRTNTVDSGKLALVKGDRVLLADAVQNQVIVYSPDGVFLGSFPVDGVPQGLGVAPQGNIAIADPRSRVIRVYAVTVK